MKKKTLLIILSLTLINTMVFGCVPINDLLAKETLPVLVESPEDEDSSDNEETKKPVEEPETEEKTEEEPEEKEEEQDEKKDILKDIYGKYLEVLADNPHENRVCDDYDYYEDYYSKSLKKTVSFCDIYGDENPEMVYIAQRPTEFDSDAYFLEIVTVEDGELKHLISNEWFGGPMAGSRHYCLFKCDSDKNLYGIYDEGDDWWETGFFVFKEQNGSVDQEVLYTVFTERDFDNPSIQYDLYRAGEEEIEEERFNSETGQIINSITEIVFADDYYSYEYYSDPYNISPNGNRNKSMTYDEALEFLINQTKEINSADVNGEKAYLKAYETFILNREYYLPLKNYPEEMGDDLKLGFGSQTEISFILYDMDNDGVPELIMNSGYEERVSNGCYGFTYYDGEIYYLGNCPTNMFLSTDLTNYPGIFGVLYVTVEYWSYYYKDGLQINPKWVCERGMNDKGEMNIYDIGEDFTKEEIETIIENGAYSYMFMGDRIKGFTYEDVKAGKMME